MRGIADILNDDDSRIWLLVATVIATVVVPNASFIYRTAIAVSGRLYLDYVIIPRKNDASTGDDGKAKSRVSGLFIHPVKSLRAVSVNEAVIDDRGFEWDRRFMLVLPCPTPIYGSFLPTDPTHRFLTQRQCPLLATVVATLTKGDDGDDGSPSRIEFSSHLLQSGSGLVMGTEPVRGSAVYRSRLWDDVVRVRDMGDDAAAFFKRIVDMDDELPDEMRAASSSVRLVVQDEDDGRVANDKYVPPSTKKSPLLPGISGDPRVSLADGFPILIACESSLEALNDRLRRKGKDPLPMSRFRPNIVVAGTAEPFEEDGWKVISIGDAVFHVVKGCPRCKQSCTDQITGRVTEEPLATLSEFRAMSSKNCDDLFFAQNALPDPTSIGATLSVGDEVRVLRRGEPEWGH